MNVHNKALRIVGIVLFSLVFVGRGAYVHAHEDETVRSDTKAQAELKSPIDLVFPEKVKIHYKTSFKGTIKVVHEKLPERGLEKEFMVQVDPFPKEPIGNNYIMVDGQRYHLVQFHVHLPSEHTINGKREIGEVHFVHQNEEGKVAVLGAFITRGDDDHRAYGRLFKSLPRLLKELPREEGESEKIPLMNPVYVTRLLPLGRHMHVYRYLGSKTSGNLAPGVKWVILTQPVRLSDAQLKLLEPITSTGTEIQPGLGRTVSIEAAGVTAQ